MKTFNHHRRGLTLLELLIVLTILVALGTIIIPTVSYLGQRSQKLATRENLCRLQELIVDRYLPDMDELPRPAVKSDDGTVLETGSVSGKRADHPQLCYLFVNPDKTYDDDDYNDHDKGDNLLSSRCWQGPYIMHMGATFAFDAGDVHGFTTLYGESGDPVIGDPVIGDPVIYDAWGHPIVLQWPTEEPAGVTEDDIERIQRLHVRLVSAGRDGYLDTPINVLMPNKSERDDDIVVFLFRHDEYGNGYLGLEKEE